MRQRSFWFGMSEILVVLAIAAMLPKWTAAAGTYKVLHVFKGGADGATATASVIFDGVGNLYGITSEGGNLSDCGGLGCGVVFKLSPSTGGGWTESVLYRFTDSGDGGCFPSGSLIFDQAGSLYGTATNCGAHGGGTVFRLTPGRDGNWTETPLYSFTPVSQGGFFPYSGVIFDGAGNLYGTTWVGGNLSCGDGGGCGVVFKLAPNPDESWTESVLYSFNGDRDGAFPSLYGGVMFDGAGNLYGVTQQGGGNNSEGCFAGGCGVVFKLAPNSDGSWTEGVLHRFTDGKDGAIPTGSLIPDTTGNLYGVGGVGGALGSGTVFILTPKPSGSWQENVLHAFSGGNDGGSPQASLIFDQGGDLYGATFGGGVRGYGVVFKLAPNPKGGWRETLLWAFRDHPSARPSGGGLTLDSEGNLYGTTGGDGISTHGTVFEITP